MSLPFQLSEVTSVPSLRERVYTKLEQLIIHGGLPAGTHLKEDELAGQLGVSRNPVREALQQLVHEELADYVSGRGVFVHTPTSEEVRDTLAVRNMLEREAIGLAVSHITPAGIDQLSETVMSGLRSMETADGETLIQLNDRFHQGILDAAGNAVLSRMMVGIRKRLTWYFAGVIEDRAPDSWREHEAILAALKSGDADLALARMNEHVAQTQRRIEHHIHTRMSQADPADPLPRA